MKTLAELIKITGDHQTECNGCAVIYTKGETAEYFSLSDYVVSSVSAACLFLLPRLKPGNGAEDLQRITANWEYVKAHPAQCPSNWAAEVRREAIAAGIITEPRTLGGNYKPEVAAWEARVMARQEANNDHL